MSLALKLHLLKLRTELQAYLSAHHKKSVRLHLHISTLPNQPQHKGTGF